MALVLKDRVLETSITTGLGDFTLAGAVNGFQSFSAIGNGNTCYYTITDAQNWEVGIGTYTAAGTSLSRDTVLASSDSGNKINFPAGNKNVFVTYPADKSVYANAAGAVELSSVTITGGTISGITDLAIADGGTGASTAANARTNLGISATNTPNTPAGNLVATTVQAALNELDTEKAKAGANTDITSLTGLTGNLGIGVSVPTAKLQIEGTGETTAPTVGGSKAASIYAVANNGVGSAGGGIEFGGVANKTFAAIKGGLADGATNTKGDLVFYNRNAAADAAMTERMRIDTSGNVGIGVTNTSGFKFAIGGSGFKTKYSTTDALNSYDYTDGNYYFGTTSANDIQAVVNNALRFTFDTTGNSLHGAATGGLGYGTGAGGQVTQATSKTTTVTLNKPTGQITMNNAALGAGATAIFVLNNSVMSNDVDLFQIAPVANANYQVDYYISTTSSIAIRVKNITAGSLSEALPLSFSIIKGSIS